MKEKFSHAQKLNLIENGMKAVYLFLARVFSQNQQKS